MCANGRFISAENDCDQPPKNWKTEAVRTRSKSERSFLFHKPRKNEKKKGVASTIFSVFQFLFPLVEAGRTAPGQNIHLSMNQAWRRSFSLTIWQRRILRKINAYVTLFFRFYFEFRPDSRKQATFIYKKKGGALITNLPSIRDVFVVVLLFQSFTKNGALNRHSVFGVSFQPLRIFANRSKSWLKRPPKIRSYTKIAC